MDALEQAKQFLTTRGLVFRSETDRVVVPAHPDGGFEVQIVQPSIEFDSGTDVLFGGWHESMAGHG